ncbi:MAG: AEC family transporter [Verrucomicrobiae bacterium]|nr:AEC family transporter [Verrucomicrobiae bacterium]
MRRFAPRVNELLTVLSTVLPVFCLAATGVVLRRAEWLTPEADASLMRVVVNVLTPALILDVALGNQALRRAENLLLAPALGFAEVAGGVALAWACRRKTGLAADREQRTFAATIGIQNYGYVPLPLVLSLFPGDTAGVLFVHNLGVDVGLWTVCLIALGHGGIREWRRLINPPITAIVLAIAINALGGDRYLPGFLKKTASMLGACAFPLGIVLIGATMADSAGDLRRRFGGRLIAWSAVLRLGILPIVILAVAWLVPSRELKQVLVVQAAMPAAVFPIVLARHYGGDPLTSVRVVIVTSLLGFLTMPLWLRLGLRLIGS